MPFLLRIVNVNILILYVIIVIMKKKLYILILTFFFLFYMCQLPNKGQVSPIAILNTERNPSGGKLIIKVKF